MSRALLAVRSGRERHSVSTLCHAAAPRIRELNRVVGGTFGGNSLSRKAPNSSVYAACSCDSIDAASTIHNGPDLSPGLFLPGEPAPPGITACNAADGALPEVPESARCRPAPSLFSVRAAGRRRWGVLTKPSTSARRFIVNHDDRSSVEHRRETIWQAVPFARVP